MSAWLDEDRDGLRLRRHLADSATAWQAAGRPAADLYRGARLESAAQWSATNADSLTPLERDFLHDAHRRNRRNRRLTRGAVNAISVLLVLALAAAGLAFIQRRRADDNAADATEASAREASQRVDSDLRRLASEAQATATSQPDLAMLLAVEAHRRQPGVASESALYAALLAQPAIRRYVDATLPPGKAVPSMRACAQSSRSSWMDRSCCSTRRLAPHRRDDHHRRTEHHRRQPGR